MVEFNTELNLQQDNLQRYSWLLSYKSYRITCISIMNFSFSHKKETAILTEILAMNRSCNVFFTEIVLVHLLRIAEMIEICSILS